MLTRSRDSQLDKAKRTMRDVIRYARDVAEDERLRADVSASSLGSGGEPDSVT